MPAQTTAIVNAALSRNAQRVLSKIYPHGAQHAGTIAQDLGLSCTTVKRHADVLAAAGLISVRCFGTRLPTDGDVSEVILCGGNVCWSQAQTPSSAWCREGETDRKPGPNSYEYVLAQKAA